MELGPWNGSVRCLPSFKFCCAFSLFSWEAIDLSWPNYLFYDPCLQTVPEESSQIFLRVGEIEYTHRSEEHWVGWVKPLLAIGMARTVSGSVLESELVPCPWGIELQQPGVCMTVMQKKKLYHGIMLLWSWATGSFSHAEAEYAVPVCQDTGLVSFPGIPAGQGGQALNLSCEISCVVTSEFKALYQDWGLENHCLNVVNSVE